MMRHGDEVWNPALMWTGIPPLSGRESRPLSNERK
jgi:hypothetical protein